VGILFVVRLADHFLGQRGTLAATAVAGAGSVSAAALSVAELVARAEFPAEVAAWAVLGAIAAAILTKVVIGRLQGTGTFAAWLTGGLLLSLSVAVGTLYLAAALG